MIVSNKVMGRFFLIIWFVFFVFFAYNRYTLNIIMAIICLMFSLYFKTIDVLREIQIEMRLRRL